MENEIMNTRLMQTASVAAKYCSVLENVREYDRKEFVIEILDLLPRIYLEFSNPDLQGEETNEYYPTYVDEDYYESIRRNVEMLMGADDVFLETFEEDMKYSDTPVSASIAESLADIFQPLYNFISVVKDSEGLNAPGAFFICKENFESYWAQTLCNVMRALNNIRYSGVFESEE